MESVRHLLHHFEPHIKVSSMSKITLRPYQIQLKADIYNAWNSGAVNVLAVSPTGSGKAMTLCTLAEELAYTYGMPTVIKVHRRELVSQLCGTLAQLGIPHNVIAQRSNILEIIEEEKRLHGKSFYEPRAPITVVSVDTLLSRAEKYAEFCQRQRVWILDEAAHQLKDNKWGKAAALFPNAIGVGFTATPQRLDKKGLGRHAFGLFDVMVQGPTVRWLIDNGFLSKYKIVTPKSDYLDHLEDNGSSTQDFTQKARTIASKSSHIVGDVVKAYKEYIFGKQAILFADCIEAAEKMEEQFNAQGIPAKLLTGETPSKERLQGVIGYRDGKIKVLLNVDLFDEGFDVPGTDAVIMARPTKSLGKYLQMCLDTDTEILTKRGWIKYDSILKGDIVPALNIESNKVEFVDIEDVVVRKIEEGESFYSFSTAHSDFRVTSHHDMIVKTRASTKWIKESIEETFNRSSMFHVPSSAFTDINDAEITDDELRFLGWYQSDGTLSRKFQVSISQAASQPHISLLRDLLKRMGVPFTECVVKRKGDLKKYSDLIQFIVSINKPKRNFKRWSNKNSLTHLLPWLDKSLPEIYDTLSRRQVEVLLTTWNLGDGKKLKNIDYEQNTMTITFGDNKHAADKMQSLLVRRGFRCSVSIEDRSHLNRKDIYNLRIKDTRTVCIAGKNSKDGSVSGKKSYKRSHIKIEKPKKEEIVWCIKNRLGTIFTRRNGKVTIMGNCGRALRVAKGKEFAYIIDHVGNCYSKHKRGAQHGLPDKIRQWTLDNIVRKRDTVSLHRFCMNEMCNLPFDRWLDACPYCGNTDKPYRRNVAEVSAREALKIVDGDMELLDPETIRELENEINLENPFDVEERVKRTAGEYAGKAARKKQQERIEMQKTLAETIARWAGREKRNGFTDRQIKKRFMMKFSEGITVALSLPKAEMQEINTMIKQDLGEV